MGASRRRSSGSPASIAARQPDPSAMTPAARLAELGDLIATGLRRLGQNLESAVAERAAIEPTCSSPVDAPSTGQEVDDE